MRVFELEHDASVVAVRSHFDLQLLLCLFLLLAPVAEGLAPGNNTHTTT